MLVVIVKKFGKIVFLNVGKNIKDFFNLDWVVERYMNLCEFFELGIWLGKVSRCFEFMFFEYNFCLLFG